MTDSIFLPSKAGLSRLNITESNQLINTTCLVKLINILAPRVLLLEVRFDPL